MPKRPGRPYINLNLNFKWHSLSFNKGLFGKCAYDWKVDFHVLRPLYLIGNQAAVPTVLGGRLILVVWIEIVAHHNVKTVLCFFFLPLYFSALTLEILFCSLICAQHGMKRKHENLWRRLLAVHSRRICFTTFWERSSHCEVREATEGERGRKRRENGNGGCTLTYVRYNCLQHSTRTVLKCMGTDSTREVYCNMNCIHC